ncbi:MAG: type II secretion system protein GspG [Spirochaeta sp.]|jgi:general secretion pathway protein G|nr:type II secretion system protein GspG [Spirochaeta sp.]
MKSTSVPGWTLVEVLTSMAIVFLLTGTIGHIGGQQIQRARRLAAYQQRDALQIALETYALDCGIYPTEAQGLTALWEPPVLHPVPAEWNGPYLEGPVTDTPWGSPYRYEAPGPDGQPYLITFEEPSTTDRRAPR